MSTSNSIRLHYFDIAALGEISRILMKIGNLPFEDVRYPFTFTASGVDSPDMEVKKKTGAFVCNMNRVPVLEIENGVTIGQSKTIERYLADRLHLFGSSDVERALIDGVTENVRDIKDKYSKVRYTTNPEEKDALIAKWFAGGELAEWLVKLERSLPANTSGDVFVAGTTPTYADVLIWQVLRDFFSDKAAASASETAAKVGRLTAIANKVGEIPALKNWLATRPVDKF